MELCVFQGTFNPIHNAHLRVAMHVLNMYNFDKLVFIPAANPPHKDCDSKYSLHRLKMAELAIRMNPRFAVSDIEYRRDGKSYTYLTIKELYKTYGKVSFIIGTDAFKKIETWYETDKLKELVKFIVFIREDNFDISKYDYLKDKGYDFEFQTLPYQDISSTELREKIKNGEDIKSFVPAEVEEYIKKMDYIKISTEDLLDWLKKNLCEERYEHSLGTAECAKMLAEKYNLDSEKAYVAGLLHDCAKCFSNEKLVAIIDKNLDIEEVEKMNCKTLHAPVSAYIAKTEFGVDDEEILSSIRWHTIGKIGMSDFEKIIFLADKIEARTREESCAGPIRTLLFEDDGLHKALLQCYKQTIKSLVDRDLTICPMTIDIYNSLQAKVK